MSRLVVSTQLAPALGLAAARLTDLRRLIEALPEPDVPGDLRERAVIQLAAEEALREVRALVGKLEEAIAAFSRPR